MVLEVRPFMHRLEQDPLALLFARPTTPSLPRGGREGVKLTTEPAAPQQSSLVGVGPGFPCANAGRSKELNLHFFTGLGFPVDQLRLW